MGETVKDDNNSSNNNTTTVFEATLRQWEQEMVDLINEERAKVGAPALTVDTHEMQFAQYWASILLQNSNTRILMKKRVLCV